MSASYPAIAFFGGLSIAVVATLVLLRMVGTRWGADKPDSVRKVHGRVVSRLGGLPIFLAFILASGWMLIEKPAFFASWAPVLACCTLIFLVGFIDDLRPLGAKVKLVGQLAIAFTAFTMGIGIDMVSNPFGAGSIALSVPISFLVTVAWLVALPNIVNLIDGMDGLASGLGMFLCLTLGVAGVISGQGEVAMIALAMGGALLGFLVFNFPPAKIFLGDGGAYLIGFFVASASLASSQKGAIIAVMLVVMIALGLPILDTAFAIVRRGIRGMPLFRADADHIHHRMLSLGFSKGTAVIALYAVCAALSLVGLSLFWTRGLSLPIAAGTVFLLALLGARYLGYVKTFRDLRNQVSRAFQHRSEIQYATLLGDLMEMEVDRCATSTEFWTRYLDALRRLDLYPSAADLGQRTGSDAEWVEVRRQHSPSWLLAYPKDFPLTKNWHGIAHCMVAAFARATERWGTESAQSAGFGRSHPKADGQSDPPPRPYPKDTDSSRGGGGLEPLHDPSP
ncbi:hypothetical protein BH23VER1_BH23VER1_27670 [soil metagenome]